jgi:uncharacterized protein YbjT (DUF2867 family)
MTILITGASGVTGTALIRKLVGKGVVPRAMTSREAGAASLAERGADPVIANMDDRASLEKAFDGVERVYHVCPVLNTDECEIGKRMIDVAKAAGVRHFVYHSVAAPFEQDVPLHWEKMKVEALLLHSGLPYTVIQPTCYMQNFEWTLPHVLRTGKLGLPYSPDVYLTWVDLDDVAEASANVLTEDGHEYGTYQLSGEDRPMNRHEVAKMLSKRFGMDVEAVKISADEVFSNSRFASFSKTSLDWGRAMFEQFDKYGFSCGNNKTLKMLIRREPTKFEAYFDRVKVKT